VFSHKALVVMFGCCCMSLLFVFPVWVAYWVLLSIYSGINVNGVGRTVPLSLVESWLFTDVVFRVVKSEVFYFADNGYCLNCLRK
jgi:hypothetical protein